MRAPASTPIEKLDQIVHRKAKWITDRKRRHEDLALRPSPREFVSGETFLYPGRQYRLKVENPKGNREQRVLLIGGHIHIPVHPGPTRRGEVREQLVRWYRSHAARRLPERVAVREK